MSQPCINDQEIAPVKAAAKRRGLKLRDLLREFKPEHRHGEVDWGKAQGREYGAEE